MKEFVVEAKQRILRVYQETPKPVLLSGTLFILLFLYAFTSFVVLSFTREKRMVFFLEYQRPVMVGEVRTIPWKYPLEERVQSLIEELLWGPLSPRFRRVFPLGTKVESILIRKGVLYVDLSPEVLFSGDDPRISWEERFRVLKKTILYNYPRFKEIVVTVNGQQPGLPPFFPKIPKNN